MKSESVLVRNDNQTMLASYRSDADLFNGIGRYRILDMEPSMVPELLAIIIPPYEQESRPCSVPFEQAMQRPQG